LRFAPLADVFEGVGEGAFTREAELALRKDMSADSVRRMRGVPVVVVVQSRSVQRLAKESHRELGRSERFGG
jgi:hypothetical protein